MQIAQVETRLAQCGAIVYDTSPTTQLWDWIPVAFVAPDGHALWHGAESGLYRRGWWWNSVTDPGPTWIQLWFKATGLSHTLARCWVIVCDASPALSRHQKMIFLLCIVSDCRHAAPTQQKTLLGCWPALRRHWLSGVLTCGRHEQ